MDRVERIWYLSPMRPGKIQASMGIRAVSPEPSLLAHTSSESRGTFRQKARSLALLNAWACAVKICRNGMLEDTNSLDEAHMKHLLRVVSYTLYCHIFVVMGKNEIKLSFLCLFIHQITPDRQQSWTVGGSRWMRISNSVRCWGLSVYRVLYYLIPQYLVKHFK